MPNKTSKKKPAAALPSIPKELIDRFVSGPMSVDEINTASMAFKKALIERALGTALSHQLGYAPGTDKPPETTNHRNGATAKRGWSASHRHSARSARTVRAHPHPEARAAVHRLRRQDRRHVRTWDDDSRDRGFSDRQSAYRELFRHCLEPGRLDEIPKATNGNYALGSGCFQRPVASTLGRRVVPGQVGRLKKVHEATC